MKEKTFIALTSEIYQDKTVHLCASSGEAITNVNGLDVSECLDFLFSLIHKRKRTGGVVFITYGFARDNEFIFSTLPKDLRDKLFVSYRIKKQINELEFENEALAEDYFNFPLGSDENQLADFELHCNRLALDELTEIEYDGYILELANGKILTIRKGKKSLTIYDIYGFFKPSSLRESVYLFLNETQPLLDRQTYEALDFFDGATDIDKLSAHATFEVNYIARLGEAVYKSFLSHDINLSRWHGASALASYTLSRAGAKKQFHNYRHRRQLPPDMHTALRQSVYGGRAEQFKIGTIKDVHVYDINSAYAAAVAQLPIMLSKPQFCTEWNNTPFSFWKVDYDFTKADPYLGLLPNRELTSFTKYKLKGSGFFWQPEVMAAMARHPECIVIGSGYTLDAERADFAEAVKNLYTLRQYLQDKRDPLERVLKLALSSMYGKFCQHNGKGYYYNLFYAAYITSVTRAQLLEAVTNNEQETICFQTDAIHSTKALRLPLSNNLGEYKHSFYDKVTYLDNGVYQCYLDGDIVKTKTRGFRRFNFEMALEELKEKRSYTALAEFFMGHNLFAQNIFTSKANYLQDFAYSKTTKPTDNDYFQGMRIFAADNVDLTANFLDSKPITTYSGLMSAPYNVGRNVQTDSCLDTIEAGRI